MNFAVAPIILMTFAPAFYIPRIELLMLSPRHAPIIAAFKFSPLRRACTVDRSGLLSHALLRIRNTSYTLADVGLAVYFAQKLSQMSHTVSLVKILIGIYLTRRQH